MSTSSVHLQPSRFRHPLYKIKVWETYDGPKEDRELVTDPSQADVMSSEIGPGGIRNPMHSVMLDIDLPAVLVPSSTEGHCHLYIDKLVHWKDYKRLLKALMLTGVIELGFYRAAKRRKATFLRLPHVKKEVNQR